MFNLQNIRLFYVKVIAKHQQNNAIFVFLFQMTTEAYMLLFHQRLFLAYFGHTKQEENNIKLFVFF